MKFFDSFILAVRALLANKMRSALTMLGVIIGVGAVITLMSVGKGVEAQITSTIEDFGSNTLNVMSQTPGVRGLAAMQSATPSMTLSDAEELRRIPFVKRVAPVSESFVEVAYGSESTFGAIEGTTEEFFLIYNYELQSGRFLNDRDVSRKDTVVVLGSKIAEELFGEDSPVGQQVRLSGRLFTVIGVLEPKGGSMMGMSMDQMVAVPVTAYQSRLFPRQTIRGEDAVQSLVVQVESADVTGIVRVEVEDLLRRLHRIGDNDKDDFIIITNEEVLGMFQQITGVLTIFLAAVAGISLLVGSIGIMNIMLVSVTERTREIGVRKAVGAKRRDILLQFLIEASVLSFIGGGIGIICGAFLSWVLSLYGADYGLAAKITPDIVILAVSVSVIIGIMSGLYPAMRASKLNPIDALHYG